MEVSLRTQTSSLGAAEGRVTHGACPRWRTRVRGAAAPEIAPGACPALAPYLLVVVMYLKLKELYPDLDQRKYQRSSRWPWKSCRRPEPIATSRKSEPLVTAWTSTTDARCLRR